MKSNLMKYTLIGFLFGISLILFMGLWGDKNKNKGRKEDTGRYQMYLTKDGIIVNILDTQTGDFKTYMFDGHRKLYRELEGSLSIEEYNELLTEEKEEKKIEKIEEIKREEEKRKRERETQYKDYQKYKGYKKWKRETGVESEKPKTTKFPKMVEQFERMELEEYGYPAEFNEYYRNLNLD